MDLKAIERKTGRDLSESIRTDIKTVDGQGLHFFTDKPLSEELIELMESLTKQEIFTVLRKQLKGAQVTKL